MIILTVNNKYIFLTLLLALYLCPDSLSILMAVMIHALGSEPGTLTLYTFGLVPSEQVF